jgi:hypothetical protein
MVALSLVASRSKTFSVESGAIIHITIPATVLAIGEEVIE